MNTTITTNQDDDITEVTYHDVFEAGRKAGFGAGTVHGIFIGLATFFAAVMLAMLFKMTGGFHG
jgi:hypothetical protein